MKHKLLFLTALLALTAGLPLWASADTLTVHDGQGKSS